MRNSILSQTLISAGLGLSLLLGSCNSSSSSNTSSDTSSELPPSPAVETQPRSSTPPSTSALAAGLYCYQLESETLSATASFNISPTLSVAGTLQGTIHDQAQGYYSSYEQQLAGTLSGSQLIGKLTTDIELDTQVSQVTWQITEQTLLTDQDKYQRQDCSRLSQAEPAPPEPGTQTKRIQFNRGGNSATVEDGVLRGERVAYTLGAARQQTMDVRITSLENNAVFDIIAPDGSVLERETMNASVLLPSDGEYQIVVGGTRGNASYTLTVTIP